MQSTTTGDANQGDDGKFGFQRPKLRPCRRFTHLEYCLCISPSCLEVPCVYELFPSIFISDFTVMFHPEVLKKQKITHVVDLSQEQYTLQVDPRLRLRLDIEDEPLLKIRVYFRRVNRFISKAIEQRTAVILVARPGSDLHLGFALSYRFTCVRTPIKAILGETLSKVPSIRLSERMQSELTLEEMAMHKFA